MEEEAGHGPPSIGSGPFPCPFHTALEQDSQGDGDLSQGLHTYQLPHYLYLWTPGEERGQQVGEGLCELGAPCTLGFNPP